MMLDNFYNINLISAYKSGYIFSVYYIDKLVKMVLLKKTLVVFKIQYRYPNLQNKGKVTSSSIIFILLQFESICNYYLCI